MKGNSLRTPPTWSYQKTPIIWYSLRATPWRRASRSERWCRGSNLHEGQSTEEARSSQKGIEGDQRTDWAMEVYKGEMSGQEEAAMEADMIELDLDEEEAEVQSRVLAIAVFYSRKSYNPRVLFADMIAAWGVQKLASVEKIGDYIFKLESVSEAEKIRVLEGGPWRHKGDSLIVTHYDGLVRPSEISIKSLRLWVRFYDMPPTMMKSCFANQLGGQLGTMITSDSRYPGYLQVRLEYPLEKPLVPQLKVKVKGRGPMLITLWYENVPHFCFACGRIGHATLNCDGEAKEEQGVSFDEELRASPPKRVRDITLQPVSRSVARPLFQVPGMVGRQRSKPTMGQQRSNQEKSENDGDGLAGQGSKEG
jgi:hypothetical protein